MPGLFDAYKNLIGGYWQKYSNLIFKIESEFKPLSKSNCA